MDDDDDSRTTTTERRLDATARTRRRLARRWLSARPRSRRPPRGRRAGRRRRAARGGRRDRGALVRGAVLGGELAGRAASGQGVAVVGVDVGAQQFRAPHARPAVQEGRAVVDQVGGIDRGVGVAQVPDLGAGQEVLRRRHGALADRLALVPRGRFPRLDREVQGRRRHHRHLQERRTAVVPQGRDARHQRRVGGRHGGDALGLGRLQRRRAVPRGPRRLLDRVGEPRQSRPRARRRLVCGRPRRCGPPGRRRPAAGQAQGRPSPRRAGAAPRRVPRRGQRGRVARVRRVPRAPGVARHAVARAGVLGDHGLDGAARRQPRRPRARGVFGQAGPPRSRAGDGRGAQVRARVGPLGDAVRADRGRNQRAPREVRAPRTPPRARARRRRRPRPHDDRQARQAGAGRREAHRGPRAASRLQRRGVALGPHRQTRAGHARRRAKTHQADRAADARDHLDDGRREAQGRRRRLDQALPLLGPGRRRRGHRGLQVVRQIQEVAPPVTGLVQRNTRRPSTTTTTQQQYCHDGLRVWTRSSWVVVVVTNGDLPSFDLLLRVSVGRACCAASRPRSRGPVVGRSGLVGRRTPRFC
mmetsp:Transcript_25657/g.102332  ORF Transcript_25657/g.102332 Transcript_25657/m.102332 type:complete len:586 (+) Transcript_25657:271-2028(+)